LIIEDKPMSKLKIGSQEKAIELSKWFRKAGKVVVTTNGVFDILHAGHVRYLAEGKALGDFLIVLVNSDGSVKRIKGEHKPYIPCSQRMEVVAALEDVDFVTWFCSDTPEVMLEKIKPNIHVKGKDWEGKHIPETEVVEKYGGEMEFVQVHSKENLSTTTIAQRIVQKELSRLRKRTTILDNEDDIVEVVRNDGCWKRMKLDGKYLDKDWQPPSTESDKSDVGS